GLLIRKTGTGRMALAGLSFPMGTAPLKTSGPTPFCRAAARRPGLALSADIPPQANANFVCRDVVEVRPGSYDRRDRRGNVPCVRVAEVEEAIADIQMQAARLGCHR